MIEPHNPENEPGLKAEVTTVAPDAGMVAHYASLADDYLERYFARNNAALRLKELRSAIPLGIELRLIAKRAYEIGERKLDPAEEKKALGEMFIEQGPSHVKNAFAIAAGAIESIARFDQVPSGPLSEQETALQERGLISGGALTPENFASLSKGLYLVSRHVGESIGDAQAFTQRFPAPKGPKALSGMVMTGENAGHVSIGISDRLTKILNSHGRQDFVQPEASAEFTGTPQPRGWYKIRGQMISYSKAIDDAIERGKQDALRR